MFNTKTGHYVRCSDEQYASYPHLIDIGIQGSCGHGRSGLCVKSGIKCYQNGLNYSKHKSRRAFLSCSIFFEIFYN